MLDKLELSDLSEEQSMSDASDESDSGTNRQNLIKGLNVAIVTSNKARNLQRSSSFMDLVYDEQELRR
jgi:hypothetical protein